MKFHSSSGVFELCLESNSHGSDTRCRLCSDPATQLNIISQKKIIALNSTATNPIGNLAIHNKTLATAISTKSDEMR
jgi:hypothetical protein